MMRQLLSDQIVSDYCKSLGTLLLLMGCMVSSRAATYNIEPINSNVRFAINHFKTSATTGGFYNVTGQLQYDPNAKTGNISLIIPIKTLNTGNKAFNLTLMGPEFFDMEQFPSARFDSTKWHFMSNKAGPQVTQVDGKLTLHGETHPVTLTATRFNCSPSSILKKSVCGGDFTATIDRTKWNIKKYALFGITKSLTLNIKVEAAQQ